MGARQTVKLTINSRIKQEHETKAAITTTTTAAAQQKKSSFEYIILYTISMHAKNVKIEAKKTFEESNTQVKRKTI